MSYLTTDQILPGKTVAGVFDRDPVIQMNFMQSKSLLRSQRHVYTSWEWVADVGGFAYAVVFACKVLLWFMSLES